MRRLPIILMACLLLFAPLTLHAEDRLATLEAAARSRSDLQPGLQSYQVSVDTGKIAEMIARMTANMPPDVPRPAPPSIIKYWLRSADESLIVTEGEATSPYVQQMVERFSGSLAVELDSLLLPEDQAARRRELTANATVKTVEAALAQSLLNRVEIAFAEPVDLDEAFYTRALRLPQKRVKALTFDIDAKTGTVSEMTVTTVDAPPLAVELRYVEVEGGNLPSRVKVTSPDGKIDDLFEVTFAQIDGFLLPVRMVRTFNRPDLTDTIDVSFRDYRVNQPLPPEILTRMEERP